MYAKTPEEAYETGFLLGETRGRWLRDVVDDHLSDDNHGLARQAQEDVQGVIERASQKKVPKRFKWTTRFPATHDVELYGRDEVTTKGQEAYDALVAGYREGVRAGFDQR